MKEIKSLQNPKIKEVIKLKKPRERKRREKFLIEGYKEIKIARSYGVNVLELYYCPDLALQESGELAEEDKKMKIPQKVFDRLSYRENGDGFLAVAGTFRYGLDDISSEEDIIPVLDDVEKPGNLGAVIRTAISAGFNALIVNDMQTDIFNPNVIRASLGGIFGMTTVEASREDTRKWLKSSRYQILATSTHARKIYTDMNYREKTALVFGSENRGISDYWRENVDDLINIPIEGEISSLNISAAAAVILYEVKRQIDR